MVESIFERLLSCGPTAGLSRDSRPIQYEGLRTRSPHYLRRKYRHSRSHKVDPRMRQLLGSDPLLRRTHSFPQIDQDRVLPKIIKPSPSVYYSSKCHTMSATRIAEIKPSIASSELTSSNNGCQAVRDLFLLPDRPELETSMQTTQPRMDNHLCGEVVKRISYWGTVGSKNDNYECTKYYYVCTPPHCVQQVKIAVAA